MLFAADDDDRDDADEALAVDLRALVERGASSGSCLEILHLRGANVIEHLVLPPTGVARVAGVEVRGVQPGVAMVDGRPLHQGERLIVPLADGELWVRFSPAPRRLLPTEASRVAIALFLIVACLASIAGAAARGLDAASSGGGAAVAGACERTHARTTRRARRRRVASRLRLRRRCAQRVRRQRGARTHRPLRRCGPRKTAPEPDGGDGSDDDERSGRALPGARARGPPVGATSPRRLAH